MIKLFSLFRRRSHKHIFRYFDGKKWKYCDPIATMMAFEAHETYRPDEHPQLMKENADREATKILCDATKDVFGLVSFNPETKEGLTLLEIMELHARFMIFLQGLKKNVKRSATKPSSTAESTSEKSSGPTTNSTSPSGSIEIATESAEPILSAKQ